MYDTNFEIGRRWGGGPAPLRGLFVQWVQIGDGSVSPGPGVGPTVAIGEELGLLVNAKAAGKGKVSCVVVQPDGSEVEAQVLENEDGTFDIFYATPAPGNYAIYVRFGGENIPRSPFKVMVRGPSLTYINAKIISFHKNDSVRLMMPSRVLDRRFYFGFYCRFPQETYRNQLKGQYRVNCYNVISALL